MKDDQQDFDPEFERATERDGADADPLAAERAYFAYWEARRQQRILEERRNESGLSIYERSRRRYRNSF